MSLYLPSEERLADDHLNIENPTIPGHGTRDLWRSLREIVSMVAGGLIAVVAIFAIVLAVSSRLSPGLPFEILGHPVMSVLSGSMAPTIHTGDLVVDDKLTAAQAANLHTGQIISFRSTQGPEIFTHRIVAVVAVPGRPVAYVTKGDANGSRDVPLVPSTNVIGLFQSRIPRAAYVLNDLHRPLVLGLLLASPLLWLLSEPLWGWARTTDGESRATETRG
jgi:signal peptidase I